MLPNPLCVNLEINITEFKEKYSLVCLQLWKVSVPTYVYLEVSSQGISMHYIEGLRAFPPPFFVHLHFHCNPQPPNSIYVLQPLILPTYFVQASFLMSATQLQAEELGWQCKVGTASIYSGRQSASQSSFIQV